MNSVDVPLNEYKKRSVYVSALLFIAGVVMIFLSHEVFDYFYGVMVFSLALALMVSGIVIFIKVILLSVGFGVKYNYYLRKLEIDKEVAKAEIDAENGELSHNKRKKYKNNIEDA